MPVCSYISKRELKMKYVWPKKSLLNLFQEANSKGEVKVELKTLYEAELLRFSLYSFRRRNKKEDQDFMSFQITIQETPEKTAHLTIFKPVEIEITKVA